MKKIYDHREFTWGLVGIALAAVCGGIMVLRGSSLKLAVIMVLMLALGWVNIAQSTKRQMYGTAVPDERDRAVSQKSAWRAYQLLVDGCMLAAVALIVAYGRALAAGSRGASDAVCGDTGVVFDLAGYQLLL